MTKMRVLHVKQPWANWEVEGIKTIEVRSRPTNIRERVAIYATLTDDPVGLASDMVSPDQHRRRGLHGYIVGTVEIDGCTQYETVEDFMADSKKHLIHTPSLLFNPEKFVGHYGWHLSDAKKLDELIPYTPPRGAIVWSNTEVEL